VLSIYRLLRRRVQPYLRRLRGNIGIRQPWPFAAAVVLYVIWRIAGGTVPLLMFRSMLFLLIGSYLWTRWMIRSVDCIYEADRREITRGEDVKLTLRFENEGFAPVPNMMAESTLPGREGPWRLVTAVPSLKSRVLTMREPLQEHGHYRLGPVRITVADPFGWFYATREVYGNRFVTVYPRIFPVTGQDLPLRRPFGNLRTRIRSFADPSNLADIRPMVPGDNPRHIHWPTSARMGEPYVREFELTASGEVNIVLDLSADEAIYPGRDARELAFDLTAGLAATCLRTDLAVGMTARGGHTDHSLRAAKGSRHLQTIMRSLAHARADCEMPLEMVLRRAGYALSAGSTILVVTGRSTPNLTSLLTSLMQSGLGVALFLVHADDGRVDRIENAYRPTPQKQRSPFPVWTLNPGTPFLDLDAGSATGGPLMQDHRRSALQKPRVRGADND